MTGIYIGEEFDSLNVLPISTSPTKPHPLSCMYDRSVILKIGLNGDMNVQTRYIKCKPFFVSKRGVLVLGVLRKLGTRTRLLD